MIEAVSVFVRFAQILDAERGGRKILLPLSIGFQTSHRGRRLGQPASAGNPQTAIARHNHAAEFFESGLVGAAQ